MAEVVDSIIAELDVRLGNYVTNFDAASAAHKRFTDSVPKMAALGISAQEAEQYANRHRTAANDVAQVEEQTTDKVVRSRKRRSDSVSQADAADIASAKASGSRRVETEQETQARLSAAVDRGLAERAAKNRAADPATSSLGRTNRYDGPAKPLFIPNEALGAGEEVEQAREIDRLTADIATKQAGLNTLKGQSRRETQDDLAAMRLERQLLSQNIEQEEILLRLESLRGAQAARNAAEAKANKGPFTARNAEQFARGSGFYAAIGGAPAIAGLATAGAAAGGVAAVEQATEYAKALKNQSDELGLSTRNLQVYQAAARNAGVTDQQLSTGLGQLAANLGKAKEGSEEQIKTFKALGINAKDFASAGDLLPTLIQRLSSISDPAHRASVETRLLGEEGRHLDPLLSGGVDKLNDLAEALERTGAILSAKDIQDLDQTARKLAEVKAQLNVDVARAVAGNASAIESLAASFANLVGNVGNAITRIEQFNSLQIRNFNGDGRSDGVHAAPGIIERASNAISRAAGGGIINQLFAPPASPDAIDPNQKSFLDQIRSGKVDKGLLDKLGEPKGPKGKSAETLAREADARQKRFEDQLAQANEQYLAAQREITANADEQLAIDTGKVETARVRRNLDIQREANEKQIDASKVKQLQAANDRAASEQKAALLVQHQVAVQASINEIEQQRIQDHIAALQDEGAFAQTTVERQRLALGALADERKAETKRLTAIVQSNDPNSPNFDPSKTDAQRAAAQDQLDTQDDRFGSRRRAILRETQSPGQAFVSSLRFNKDDKNEFIQNEEVKALADFNKGLDSSVQKALHLHGIFGDIIGDLIDMAIKQALIKPLANSLFGGQGAAGSGGGLGGLLGSLAGAIGIGGGSAAASAGLASGASDYLSSFSAGIPGFANGGSATIGGNPGIDQNVLSINGRPSLRVGQGEQLTVTPIGAVNQRVASPSSPTSIVQHFHIDASNSVNPDGFEDRILSKANGYATKAAATAGRQAAEASPAVVRRQQTLGS